LTYLYKQKLHIKKALTSRIQSWGREHDTSCYHPGSLMLHSINLSKYGRIN